ncbi:DUF3168 domain-containing protein [Paenibacillus sp. sgz302251]|uniref:DUF3168 domain-containing protein n=1 Tax=Paenibacillus sp. sgz302251 TaxID=3414493 RepID=UPI003C7ABDCD
MSFEAALSDELEAIAGLAGKVFPLFAPEFDDDNNGIKAPYIRYQSNYGVNGKTLDGFTSDREIECDIKILAVKYREMKELVEQVMNVLKSFERRAIGSGAFFIQEITFEPPAELYEPLPRLNRCDIVFTVHL